MPRVGALSAVETAQALLGLQIAQGLRLLSGEEPALQERFHFREIARPLWNSSSSLKALADLYGRLRALESNSSSAAVASNALGKGPFTPVSSAERAALRAVSAALAARAQFLRTRPTQAP